MITLSFYFSNHNLNIQQPYIYIYILMLLYTYLYDHVISLLHYLTKINTKINPFYLRIVWLLAKLLLYTLISSLKLAMLYWFVSI